MKMMMMRKMMNLLSCLEGGNVMSSITLMYVYPSSSFSSSLSTSYQGRMRRGGEQGKNENMKLINSQKHGRRLS